MNYDAFIDWEEPSILVLLKAFWVTLFDWIYFEQLWNLFGAY